MQHAPPNSQNIEMSLREHLLAASAPGQQQQGSYPPPPSATQSGPDHPYHQNESHSPHAHHDPSLTGQQMPYGMDNGQDDGMSPNTAKGKRELSTSKRAAQNRAAQRAFRQRKEGYIKKLEEQVKDLQTMEQNYRGLQNENYQLRDYILNLQERLLETQSDYPPAPSSINLGPGGGSGPPPDEHQLRGEMQQSHAAAHDALSQLQAAAAQASEAQPQESPYSHAPEPSRDAK